MKIKNLALALLTVAATSAFAQDNTAAPAQEQPPMQNGGMMMSPSMDDQDYSDYKEYFRKLRSIPVGSTSAMKKAMDEVPQARDEYDYKVIKMLTKELMPENSRPMRNFDNARPQLSFDAYFMALTLKANAYRRELIREDEARRADVARMSGRPVPPMSSGM